MSRQSSWGIVVTRRVRKIDRGGGSGNGGDGAGAGECLVRCRCLCRCFYPCRRYCAHQACHQCRKRKLVSRSSSGPVLRERERNLTPTRWPRSPPPPLEMVRPIRACVPARACPFRSRARRTHQQLWHPRAVALTLSLARRSDAKRPCCSTCVRSHAYAVAHAVEGAIFPDQPECTYDEGTCVARQ